MAKAVLDTNVVVSGLRNPEGNAADVLKLAESRTFRCYVSKEILNEYEEVLTRQSLRLEREQIRKFVRMLRRTAIVVTPSKRIEATSDPDDNVFLECATEARADYVVTGNLRHFPARFHDIRVVSPRQFLSILATQVK
jgi:putative PIN family toxin of toxin-antitoxin system